MTQQTPQSGRAEPAGQSFAIVRRVVPQSESLPADLHPVTRRVLAGRGVTAADGLDVSLKQLIAPDRMSGMDIAVDVLKAALRAQQRIVVVGDFDADGATSTALALRALKAMGAQNVGYLVPNRFKFGYGLTPEIVAVAAEQEPALIITVDNGISSVEGVARAAELGIQVLITDHHLPGDALPPAAAIVNPNVPGDQFPSKALAGVGVIFYLMLALRRALRDSAWFDEVGIQEPNLATLLDLVALGTVADVVPLDINNRRLVAQGLQRIRAGHCQAGVTALITAAGRDQARLTATDLGFALGPRLNAAGRLSDMSVGIECLLSDDAGRCEQIAGELDRLNRERREIEQDMREDAFLAIEAQLDALEPNSLPSSLCVFDEQWHQGVIGIVAARVKDRFHRPTIAFAPDGETHLKGSARSIPGLHIRDVLDRVAARYPSLLDKFGGHAMAAGLTLEKTNFEDFCAALEAIVPECCNSEIFSRTVTTDGSLGAADFSLDLARELRAVAPWGQEFPAPLFDDVFVIRHRRVVGENHARLKLRHESAGTELEAIAFNSAGAVWFANAETIRAAYRLDVNEYRGIESLQLIIEHAAAI